MIVCTQPFEPPYLDIAFWQMFLKRLFWFFLLFCAELAATRALSGHEAMLAQFAVIVVFMPVITATGGNSGSQAASLITRSLALGELGPRDWFRIARREFLSGIVLGTAVGILGLAAVFLFHREHPMFAIVLILALVAVTTAGSLVGSLMPLVFKRMGMDPAISSGPFVSSLVDVVGLFIYCSIAAAILYTFA